ncbi:MAG: hypothetical protein AAF466_03320 [Bacteroidota bacterium]
MKKYITFLFALLLTTTLFAQVPQSEQNALRAFYDATGGDQWDQQWDLEGKVADLPGVTVLDGHVTEIRMLFNNLTGNLPASLSDLTQLKVLELSFNQLDGAIPESIGSLQQLEVLALNGNQLTGPIPASIGALYQLKQLHLSSNQLSGDLPVELNELVSLEVFNVFDNDLSCKLPSGLASNRNMREFIVAENRFEKSDEISSILLINSGNFIDLNEDMILNPNGKTIIAIETSEDEN